MPENSNVIEGPWLKNLNPPQSLEDVEDSIKQIRDLHVQELVSQIAGDTYMALATAGFDNTGEKYTKDLALIAESIRSYILRSNGEYHPIQDVSDNIFEWTEEGNLRTQSSINIEFHKMN